MLKKIIKSARVCVLVFCIALTTVVQAPKANAVIGAATGVLPVLIVGAAFMATGTVFNCTAIGTHNSNSSFWPLGFFSLLTGVIMLDANQSTATLQKISVQKAQEYGLTPSQHAAYNEAVRNSELDAVLQTAGQELAESKDKNVYVAGAIMKNLLNSLDPDASDAFYKISTSLAIKASS